MNFKKKSFTDVYTSMVLDTRQRIPDLNDFEEGSVIRSLYESFSYELTLLYEQMELVYKAGFVDTAEQENLDRVVAILGIKRNEPDFASGAVTFKRESGLENTITIPVDTLVTTEEDDAEGIIKKAYFTIETVKLVKDATEITVRVQAEKRGKEMITDAEQVIVMPLPIPGVKSVINKEKIRLFGRSRQENDIELRNRAKNALLASGKASQTSIENALLAMPKVSGVHIRERHLENNNNHYGIIEIYIDGLNDKNEAALRECVDHVRAAGVYAILKPAAFILVNFVLDIELDVRIVRAEQRQIVESKIITQVKYFIAQFEMGTAIIFSRLISEVLKVPEVNDLTDFNIVTSASDKVYTMIDKRIEVSFFERFMLNEIDAIQVNFL